MSAGITKFRTGRVKWFDARSGGRGFGFITPDGPEQDCFVHIRDVRASGIDPDNLKPGDRVSYVIRGDHTGRDQADSIKLLDD